MEFNKNPKKAKQETKNKKLQRNSVAEVSEVKTGQLHTGGKCGHRTNQKTTDKSRMEKW